MTPRTHADVDSQARRRLEAGVFGALPWRRWIAVTGRDAGAHLHAMLTQDLLDLPEGDLRYAALLDDRAHYLADAWVLRPEGGWWLDAPSTVAGSLRERLTLFAVSAEAELTDASATHALFHWEGRSAHAISVRFGVGPDTGPDGKKRCGALSFEGATVLWAERSLFGEAGVTCLVPRAAEASFGAALDAAGRGAGLHVLTPELGTRLRIEAGRPLGGVDVTEEHLLPETGLWGAVSWSKGCFPGQEILQRVARQGRLQRRLTGVRAGGSWATAPSGTVAVIDPEGSESGRVTSAAPAGDEAAAIGLAWLRRREDHSPASWRLEWAGQQAPCEIVEPPFVALASGPLVDSIRSAPAHSGAGPVR